MIVPRRRKDGKISYQVRVSVRGKRLPAETFDTLKEAKRRERELLSLHEKASYTRKTCGAFAEEWPKTHSIVKTGPTRNRRKTKETLDGYRSSLKPFVEAFEDVLLIDLAADRPKARAFAGAHPKSAVVVRNMMQDALNDGMIPSNPFARLEFEQKPGRKHYAPLARLEVEQLGKMAFQVHGPEWGAVLDTLIWFTYLTGPREQEICALLDEWIDLKAMEVFFGVAKFDKPRTVLLLPEAAERYRAMPKRVDLKHGHAFWSKKEHKPLSTNNLWSLWNQVQKAWWVKVPAERKAELVDVDFHSLRHACGHLFYVELGFSDEETAHQLGHSDAKLVRQLYGHARHGALDRMKQKMVQQGRTVPVSGLRAATR